MKRGPAQLLGQRWIAALSLLPGLGIATSSWAEYTVSLLGTQPIARGHAIQYGWPKGALELANHPLRAQGWHPVFSECPNDTHHFGYRLVDAREANLLLQALREFGNEKPVLWVYPDSEFRWERLAVLPQPNLPQDKDAAQGYQATFVLGSQVVLDQWWQRLPGGNFRGVVYKEPPKAVAPSLWLYVGNGKIDLRQLWVPADIQVKVPSSEELKTLGAAPDLIEKLRVFAAAHRDRRL